MCYMLFVFSMLVAIAHGGEKIPQKIMLDDYINQVRSNSPALKSYSNSAEGAELRVNEQRAIILPQAFFEWNHLDDKKPTITPAFQGTETKYTLLRGGIIERTPVGLDATLSYNVATTEIIGASPALLPLSKFTDVYPKLELSQSLLKNGFGRSLRLGNDAKEAQARAAQYQATYSAKRELAFAELAYWNLSIAREMVKVRSESLKRATDLKNWTSKRERLGLGDRSDYLQAEAAYRLYEIEVKRASEQERQAAIDFNLARGVLRPNVEEELEPINPKQLIAIAAPKTSGDKLDVKAAIETARATNSLASLSRDQLLPDLQVFGSYAWNGRGGDHTAANTNLTDPTKPTWTAGLRVSVPLDQITTWNSRDGYAKEALGAEQLVEYKQLQQSLDLGALKRLLEDTRERLSLVTGLEQAQHAKIEHEQERLSRGRTTTYQLILFEQDYANARAERLHTAQDFLRTNAQLKLFESETSK